MNHQLHPQQSSCPFNVHNPPNPSYYYDEQDAFVGGDYSESGGFVDIPVLRSSQHLHPDVQELYRRKPLSSSSQMLSTLHNCQPENFYMPPDYLVEPKSSLRTNLMHQNCSGTTPHHSNSAYAEPPNCRNGWRPQNYIRDPYNASSFRSTPQIPTINYQRHISHPHPLITRAAKRFPVTFRATRYFRRPIPPASLYKRPSALCLPLSCQPDPAVCKRNHKQRSSVTTVSDHRNPPQDAQTIPSVNSNNNKTNSSSTTGNKKVTAAAVEDVTKKENDGPLKRMSSIERIVNDMDEDEYDYVGEDHRKQIAKLSKYLKPRVPNSMKEREDKLRKVSKLPLPVKVNVSGLEKNDVSPREESPQTNLTHPLDVLLNHLQECDMTNLGDCIDCLNIQGAAYDIIQQGVTCETVQQAPTIDETKSFNYQDITKHFHQSQEDIPQMVGSQITEELLQETNLSEDDHQTYDCFNGSTEIPAKTSTTMTSKQSLDDNCALELHRSKSYIVNLIDRALSKELGTVPEDKCQKKQFEKMTPKKAINLMNRHCKLENGMCLEVTQTLAETLSSPASNSQPESKHSGTYLATDEPEYIKQLKDLRWGHFRHIQQEVRRLEDLERFLDSCGASYKPY